MRFGWLFALSCLAWMGCVGEQEKRLPPTDRFYFPLGLAHVDSPDDPEGTLFVANSNFDLGYDYGSLLAVQLSKVGEGGTDLPAFPATTPASGAPTVGNLNVSEGQSLYVGSFAGEIGTYNLPNGDTRLFVPTRGQDVPLHAVDFNHSSKSIQCFGQAADLRNCTQSAVSLSQNEKSDTGLPRAPSAFGVAVSQSRGEVLVTHLRAADSPTGSNRSLTSYVVRFSSTDVAVSDNNFINIGNAASNSVVVGQRYAYLTGRFFGSGGPLIRAFDLNSSNRVVEPAIENSFSVLESRGVAMSSDETRLYVAGRTPDMLAVIRVEGSNSDDIQFKVVRSIPLPPGANSVHALSRGPGRGDLVVITCSSSRMVVFYDDELGTVVSRISNMGAQPSSIAVDVRGQGARLFISNFEDGQVAVIDVADISKPDPQLVAYLGRSQACLLNGTSCEGDSK